MSEFGMLVVSDSGTVQINSRYSNYVLHAHGSAVVGSGGRWRADYDPLSSVPLDEMPLGFVRYPYAGTWSITACDRTGIAGWVVNNSGDRPAGVGQTIEWAVFRKGPIADSDFGLSILDETGTKVFDSGDRLLRVTTTVDLHPWTPAVQSIKTINLPSALENPWVQIHNTLLDMTWDWVYLLGIRSPSAGVIESCGIQFYAPGVPTTKGLRQAQAVQGGRGYPNSNVVSGIAMVSAISDVAFV